MERQNEIAQVIAHQMASIPCYRWGNTRRDHVFNRWVDKAFPDNNGLRSHDANQVSYKVSENYEAWKTHGYPGKPPQYDQPSWARFCNCGDAIQYEQNGDTWGVKLPLEPYNPEWFRLRTGSYQEQFLTQYAAGEAKFGDAELTQRDDGTYLLNQTVTLTEHENTDYTPETYLGVDAGLDNIATVAAINNDDIQQVELFSGDDVAHHRQRLRNLRSELQEAGQAEKVEELRGFEQRYCAQRNHEISRRIVEIATEYEKPVIVLENLTHIRDRINEQQRSNDLTAALNNWTFAELQSMIEYKAAKEGLKTTIVDPSYTSQTCNKCGQSGTRPYKENQSLFYCQNCEYEVNADVNAAVNLADI